MTIAFFHRDGYMPFSKQSSKIRHKGSTIEGSQILIISVEISSQPWAFLLSGDRISLRTFSPCKSPSIKDIERQARGEGDAKRFVFGPGERRQTTSGICCTLVNFETGFAKFLADDFKDESNSPLISGKERYCAVDKKCTKYPLQPHWTRRRRSFVRKIEFVRFYALCCTFCK